MYVEQPPLGDDTPPPPAGILEQSTGAPTWLFKGALWLVGVGFLIRALEPAAHAARRVATGEEKAKHR